MPQSTEGERNIQWYSDLPNDVSYSRQFQIFCVNFLFVINVSYIHVYCVKMTV